MANFVVYYEEVQVFRVMIEAGSAEEARAKFWEFDFDAETVKPYPSETLESIEVWEESVSAHDGMVA